MNKSIKLEIGPKTPGDRVRAWTRMLGDNVIGVECLDAGDNMRASVTSRAVDNGSVTRARFTSQRLARPPYLIKQANEDRVLIAVIRSGGHVVQQGRQDAILQDGGVYLLDEGQPFEAVFSSDMVEHCALHVPKAALVQRVGSIEDIAFGPEVPLQKLVSTFVNGLVDSLDELEPETLNSLLDQALDLIGLMIAGRNRGKIEPSTHRGGTLLRIKAYVRANLRDDDLTIEGTARALGISSRYVNALLATDGTSFGRFLLAERLEGARRAIMDPRRVHRQVTEVAFDWGFRNASHFGRAFKEKYGMSPRDAKYGRC